MELLKRFGYDFFKPFDYSTIIFAGILCLGNNIEFKELDLYKEILTKSNHCLKIVLRNPLVAKICNGMIDSDNNLFITCHRNISSLTLERINKISNKHTILKNIFSVLDSVDILGIQATRYIIANLSNVAIEGNFLPLLLGAISKSKRNPMVLFNRYS